jgi:hypothetical protein
VEAGGTQPMKIAHAKVAKDAKPRRGSGQGGKMGLE